MFLVVLIFLALSQHTSARPSRDLDFDEINDRVRVGGLPLFQGDMVMEDSMVSRILTDDSVPWREKRRIRRLIGKGRRGKRAAVKAEYRIWGDGIPQAFNLRGDTAYGIIPYKFDRYMPYRSRQLAEESMRHWEERTRGTGEEHCIKFVPWTTEETYIRYQNINGCWSKVGKKSTPGYQTVALGPQCSTMGLIAHEIGHALGFFHEQSRPDRDQWIRIVEENVRPGRTYNFIKYSDWLVDPRNVEYDYSSIMHYKTDAFTKNGKDTLEPVKELEPDQVIGQRVRVSDLDVKQIRRMYGCPELSEPTIKPATTKQPTAKPATKEPTEAPATTQKRNIGSGYWSWNFRKGIWVWVTS